MIQNHQNLSLEFKNSFAKHIFQTLVTLAILAQSSRFIYSLSLYNSILMPQLVFPLILLAIYFVKIVPFCIQVASNCDFTKDLLRNGWTPVLSAMVISSLGGKKIDYIQGYSDKYKANYAIQSYNAGPTVAKKRYTHL